MQRSNVLGRAVANWVNDHMMVPLDDDDGEDDCGSHGHYQGQPVHDHSDGSNNDSEETPASPSSASLPGFRPSR